MKSTVPLRTFFVAVLNLNRNLSHNLVALEIGFVIKKMINRKIT